MPEATTLEIFFSQIYQLISHQSDSSANHVYQQIIDNLQKDYQYFQEEILSQNERFFFRNGMNTSEKISIVFYCAYGGALVFHKKQSFSPISVSLVFPKQWDFNIQIKQEKITYFADHPKSTIIFQVGQLEADGSNMQGAKEKILKMVAMITEILKEQENLRNKKYKDKDRKNHHTPSFLLQIVKQSFRRKEYGQEKKQKQPDKKEQKKQPQQVLSKGGTLDVGTHTGTTKPNTTFPVVISVLEYIFQSKNLVKLIIFDQRLNALQRQINSNKQFQLERIKKYQECLSELIYTFKKYVNDGIKFNEDVYTKAINQMSQILKNVPRFDSKQKITIKQIVQSVNYQMSIQKKYSFSTILKYDVPGVESMKMAGTLGLSKSFSQIASFKDLYEKKSIFPQSYWFMMVQSYFFSIAYERLGSQNRPIQISIQQIRCNPKALSKMHEVIHAYGAIIKNKQKARNYGMKLLNQSYSHYYLIRLIGAAVAFEVVKEQRKNKKANLADYRCPESITHLYQHFSSLSYEARNALQSMVAYFGRHQHKKQLFVLQQSSKSYYQFANDISEQDLSIKNWKKSKKEKLDKEIDKLENIMAVFKQRYQSVKSEKVIQDVKVCTCFYEDTGYKRYNQKRKVTCLRCKTVQQLQQRINKYQKEKQDQIKSDFPQYQINLYGFLNNIPSDILGMAKVIFQSQINPIQQDKCQTNDKNFFTTNYSELVVFSSEVKSGKVSLCTNYTKSARNFVNYPSKDTKFYYRGNQQFSKISQDILASQKIEPNLFHLSHQYMVNSPNDSNTREHEAYSKINLKKRDQGIEQYLGLASIRVASHTELLMLTQKIKNRQILIKFLIKDHKLGSQNEKLLYLKSLIVLNSMACVQSFKFYKNDVFNLYPIVRQCIVDLLKNYLNLWRYQDMYFLHITGITFSLISKFFGLEKYVIQIASKAFSEYQKSVRQNKSGDNAIKSHLAYFLHAAFSFFNEDITFNLDRTSILLWTKLHLMYRINKVFSDQNIKDPRFRQTMIFFQNYRERSIFNNIQNVATYFKKRPSQLTQIIQLIDIDINPTIVWVHSKQKGDYTFTGIYDNKIYEVNLYTGILLKNRSELAGLPQIIKKNRNYISIFGQNRDLQVYPQKDGSLRTRSDFSVFFPNEPKTIILFEFKVIANDVIIRKIIKRNNKEYKYILIPQVILNESNFQMPQLYLKVYFAWYCQEENILVFRCKKLEELKNVCLIMLAKGAKDKLQVIEARIVENNLKLQSISTLKQEKLSNLFDLLVFHPKNAALNKAIKAMSSIENPSYILHISSPNRLQVGVKRYTKFWMHRYNLKFTVSNQKGLLSDNYPGYAISEYFDNNQYLPWSSEDQIKCMILVKINDNLRFAKNHQTMVLVPDTQIGYAKQKNLIPSGPTTQMKLFSYEIHDHFHDLRGKNMLQQLHLACLVAVGFSPNLMTNVEYALHILRSCQSIRPLKKEQLSKLVNILQNSIYLNQYILTLVCEVVYQSSKLVQNILPFQKKKKQKEPQTKNLFLQSFELIQNCKFKYRTDFNEQKISIRVQLSKLELKILRLDNYIHLYPNFNKEKSKWQQKYKSIITISQNYETQIIVWKDMLNESYELKRKIISKSNNQNQNTTPKDVLSLEGRCKMSTDQKQQIISSLKSYSNIKRKLNQINLTQQEKKYYLKKLNAIKSSIQSNATQILKMIAQTQEDKQINLDFTSKKRSILKQIDFTNILCNQEYLSRFYPDTDQKVLEKFKNAVLLWMQHTIQYNSIQRLQQVLKDQELDKISLLREIQSPRKEISKNVAWISFETEMKTQIWLSQYQTFKLLSENITGVVTQLNMGQGKTQVIIPMLVLNEIYNKKDNIPRVNILTPLYHEAQENYFKFLSITGFKLHLLPICFNRQVQINPMTINKLQYAIDLYKNNSLVLVDRDSTLSMILKMREQHGFKKNKVGQSFSLDEQCHKKDRWIFRNLKILDIFDEVDALMTAKKSFVYAVGHSTQLPNSRVRFEYSYLFLEIVIKEMIKELIDSEIAVLDECYDHAASNIFDGKYPKGFRFLARTSEAKIQQFRQKLVRLFFTKYLPPQFQFYKNLSNEERQALIKYCICENQNQSKIPSRLSNNLYNQIYIVRGLLAYGVIQHCLTLRNGVDYGAPGVDNIKRVGVPYEAADVPSKRSEYSHPEVATILSYLSYFNKGLTYKEFEEALRCLLRQTNSSQQRNYSDWIKCVQNQSIHPLSAKNVKQINEESSFQKQELYKAFQHCRATIVFWLVHCVFPTDLAQYKKSITSSSWDLADSKNAVGFSGTKDTHWLFPEYLYLKESTNDEINGTDGKMIQLMLENTKDVIKIKDNDEDLWKRFCQTALELKTGCIIDAGAILAGKSLQKEIVPWISNHPLFKKLYLKGISYCNENGVWKVYDTSTHSTIARETSIPEHETFVIFDEARTRGADIKLKTDTIASLSLGPNMTKDKLMQAVGRLRKFGRNQKIYILSTLQNYSKIDDLNLSNSVVCEKTRKILEWVCRNSINDNKKMMYPNSKLAWIHFNNTKCKEEVVVQQFDPTLRKMYEGSIRFDTIQNLNQGMAYEHIQRYGDCQLVVYLQQNISKFGDNYMVRCQSLEDICEREIQMIEQAQRTAQIETASLEPISETSYQQINNSKISTLDIRLHERLIFTTNFIQCTKSKSLYPNKKKEEQNELCLIHFALINPNDRSMMILTQRQANSKIESGVKFLGPENIDEAVNSQFLVRFQDLSIKSRCIQQFGLERALTDAQYFNGKENFENKQLLLETIRDNHRYILGSKVEQILCHFLERRRTVEDKYMCSHLEAVCKQIINER